MPIRPKIEVVHLFGEQRNSLAEDISYPTSKHLVWSELHHLPIILVLAFINSPFSFILRSSLFMV